MKSRAYFRKVQVCLHCMQRANPMLYTLHPLPPDTSSISSSTAEVLKIHPSVAVPEDVEVAAGFSCETFLPCDPRRWLHRFLMVFLMCSLSFGSYYVYDNPAALQRTFINVSEHFIHIVVCVGTVLYGGGGVLIINNVIYTTVHVRVLCITHANGKEYKYHYRYVVFSGQATFTYSSFLGYTRKSSTECSIQLKKGRGWARRREPVAASSLFVRICWSTFSFYSPVCSFTTDISSSGPLEGT